MQMLGERALRPSEFAQDKRRLSSKAYQNPWIELVRIKRAALRTTRLASIRHFTPVRPALDVILFDAPPTSICAQCKASRQR